MYGFAIMNDNDILQTKYISNTFIHIGSSLIGNALHIVIENVTKNMDTEYSDAKISESTTIRINDDSSSNTKGTCVSTIVPENVTVELDCEVVETDGNIITARCYSETTWPDSVFNRIPIFVSGGAYFGLDYITNMVLLDKRSFQISGSVPSGWNQYNVTGSGSNLTIGDNQVTIMGLPESFVSHWVNTIHAKAYMGGDRAMLVPPNL